MPSQDMLPPEQQAEAGAKAPSASSCLGLSQGRDGGSSHPFSISTELSLEGSWTVSWAEATVSVSALP